MATIVFIDVATDAATSAAALVRSQYISYASTKFPHHEFHHVTSSTVARIDIFRLLRKADYVSFFGHGRDDAFFGAAVTQPNPPLLLDASCPNSFRELRGKIVSIWGCGCGSMLGEVLVRNGVRAFVGFSDRFRIDPYIPSVDMSGIIAYEHALLSGLSVKKARLRFVIVSCAASIVCLPVLRWSTAWHALMRMAIFVGPFNQTVLGRAQSKIR